LALVNDITPDQLKNHSATPPPCWGSAPS